MTASNYDACLKKILKYEGGYTNHPSDPGGPTNWGITIHDARMYWKKDATAEDVRSMPLSVAKEIYRKRYWDKMSCDTVPQGPDLCKFDSGVNSGVGRGEKWYAAAKDLSPIPCVKKMCAIRLSFLHGLKTWGVFGRGWGSRVADVEATGVRMALEAAGKPAGEVKDTLSREGSAAGKKATSGAVKAGTTVAAPTGTQVPDTPVHVDVTSFDWTTKIGITIGCVALGVLVVYFVWHTVQNYHRKAAYEAAAKEAALKSSI